MIMDNIMMWIKFVAGAVCSFCTALFGGLDYLTGLMVAVYTKTVSSEIGYKGLLKKVGILIIIAVAHLVGQAVGIAEIRSFVIGFYIANEAISITENVGNMGVPLPEKLMNVLGQLRDME